MEQWERDIDDLKIVLTDLMSQSIPCCSSLREFSLKLVEVIAEAKSRAVRCYINYSQYGRDMESNQSSAPQDRK